MAAAKGGYCTCLMNGVIHKKGGKAKRKKEAKKEKRAGRWETLPGFPHSGTTNKQQVFNHYL